MYKYDLSNKELANYIRLAVEGNEKATIEIIAHFQNLINNKAKINGKFSAECKDYIEDRIFKQIKNFRKIKKI